KIEQMQTDSSRQSRELQKHKDEREQIRQTANTTAADLDTCIAHNYKNTEMNECRSDRQTEEQQIQAAAAKE
ncbi:hypothetical protein Tco_0577387, partial [Tanacetum coccineum]